MVDGIHRHAADGGPDATPADAARLADRLQVVFLVAHLAYGRAAIEVNLADFARAQSQLRVASFPREELHRGAGRARELCAPTGLHFHAMNGRSDRDVTKRQAVPGLDR